MKNGMAYLWQYLETRAPTTRSALAGAGGGGSSQPKSDVSGGQMKAATISISMKRCPIRHMVNVWKSPGYLETMSLCMPEMWVMLMNQPDPEGWRLAKRLQDEEEFYRAIDWIAKDLEERVGGPDSTATVN